MQLKKGQFKTRNNLWATVETKSGDQWVGEVQISKKVRFLSRWNYDGSNVYLDEYSIDLSKYSADKLAVSSILTFKESKPKLTSVHKH